MEKTSVRNPRGAGHVLAMVVGLAITFVGGGPAEALTNISACGFTASTSPDTAYVVTANISTTVAGQTCITLDVGSATLFLGGFTITCTGGQGSTEKGVKVAGVSNVTVIGPGTIKDCNKGVHIDPSSNLLVKGLLITGPPSPGAGSNPRPASQGILVQGTVCPTPADTVVNIMDNEVENHTEGIELDNADCVNVHRNFVHDNNSDPIPCRGIVLANGSDNNNIGHNVVTENGENLAGDAGIAVLGGTTNIINHNDTSGNCGDGIRVEAAGNHMVGNTSKGNPNTGLATTQCFAATVPPGPFFDMRDTAGASANKWNKNNICNTESGLPAGVCSPSE